MMARANAGGDANAELVRRFRERAGRRRRARSAPPGDAPSHLRCPHARPLIKARNCRDVFCEARGFVACRASDCITCPIPAGRLLTGPGAVG